MDIIAYALIILSAAIENNLVTDFSSHVIFIVKLSVIIITGDALPFSIVDQKDPDNTVST